METEIVHYHSRAKKEFTKGDKTKEKATINKAREYKINGDTLLELDIEIALKPIYQPEGAHQPQGKGLCTLKYWNEGVKNLMDDFEVRKSDDLQEKEVFVHLDGYGKALGISKLNSH